MTETEQSIGLLRMFVTSAKGSDLERVQKAFAFMTEEQFRQPWGQSGQTPEQIMAQSRESRRQWENARDFLEHLLAYWRNSGSPM